MHLEINQVDLRN